MALTAAFSTFLTERNKQIHLKKHHYPDAWETQTMFKGDDGANSELSSREAVMEAVLKKRISFFVHPFPHCLCQHVGNMVYNSLLRLPTSLLWLSTAVSFSVLDQQHLPSYYCSMHCVAVTFIRVQQSFHQSETPHQLSSRCHWTCWNSSIYKVSAPPACMMFFKQNHRHHPLGRCLLFRSLESFWLWPSWLRGWAKTNQMLNETFSDDWNVTINFHALEKKTVKGLKLK